MISQFENAGIVMYDINCRLDAHAKVRSKIPSIYSMTGSICLKINLNSIYYTTRWH